MENILISAGTWSSESVMFWGGLVRSDLSAVRFQDERLQPITGLLAGPVGAWLHMWQQFLDDEDVRAAG